MMKPVVLISMMVLASAVHAVQFPLGVTDAPSCTPTFSDPNAGAPSRRGRDRTPKKGMLNAIVEGQGADDPAHRQVLQACADAAVQQIGLRVLAAQPAESNPLFKKVFLRCVAERNLPVRIYVVALKLEGHCEPGQPARR